MRHWRTLRPTRTTKREKVEEKAKAQSRATTVEELDTTWLTAHRKLLDNRRRARALKRARRANHREKAVRRVTGSLDLTLGRARVFKLGTVGMGLIASSSILRDSVGRSPGQEKLIMLILQSSDLRQIIPWWEARL